MIFRCFFFVEESENYSCNEMCNGCWSTSNTMCQLCKTYKIGDVCVDHCNNTTMNDRY